MGGQFSVKCTFYRVSSHAPVCGIGRGCWVQRCFFVQKSLSCIFFNSSPPGSRVTSDARVRIDTVLSSTFDIPLYHQVDLIV